MLSDNFNKDNKLEKFDPFHGIPIHVYHADRNFNRFFCIIGNSSEDHLDRYKWFEWDGIRYEIKNKILVICVNRFDSIWCLCLNIIDEENKNAGAKGDSEHQANEYYEEYMITQERI